LPSDTASLFAQHRGSLIAYAARIVGSRVQAEDVVQEAWLKLRLAEEQRTVLEPVAYLYRLVRNLAIDTRRKLSREVGRGQAEDSALGIADETPSAERAAAAKDELRLVLEALAALPERTQIAVRMNRIEGRTLQEVANHLDLSVTRTFTIVAEGVAHCDRWRARAVAAAAGAK
jgi:RNA polymerase sigma-70 factor (ECF subfamily)